MTWHVAEEDLRAYVRGELTAPLLWSADTHLAGCAECRSRLAGAADPVALDEAWERMDAELDAPRPSLAERLLMRLGVADHTARLLTATPVLRRSWLLAVLSLLVMTVLAVHLVDRPALFLALAPLLPLGGVALSYGPALDPSYEMAVVAPMDGFRLLMIRTVAVLTAGLAFNGLATLALPEYGLLALTWLLPALALTATGLALTPRLGPVLAPGLVGGAWVTLLAVVQSQAPSGTTLVPFTAAGQSASAAIAALATVLLYQTRDRFDARPVGGFADGGAV
ncbi:zf-HC2 domain-containing protein [Streptomyces bobili]|uniref:anti-sigma factor family protein n=1 Tax=Streptomyces bobili TaxID=67280 RepID=UPI00344521FA